MTGVEVKAAMRIGERTLRKWAADRIIGVLLAPGATPKYLRADVEALRDRTFAASRAGK